MIEADVARIVAGLTKAQRRVVDREGISDEPMITVRVMMRKGLLYHHKHSPNGQCGPMRLTPLGLAVRKHLANAGNMVPVDGGEG